MGIEFRLGRTDHKVTEDFLATGPSGVSAVILDIRNAKRQQGVVEAARAAGLPVVLEPLTERLVEAHFAPDLLNVYGDGQLLDPSRLTSLSDRSDLVERVVDAQVGGGSFLVPPHFFVNDEAALDLNLALAGLTTQHYGQSSTRIRAVLSGSRAFLCGEGVLRRALLQLKRVGVSHVDVRLSPLGGEDEGAAKIRSTFRALANVRDIGLPLTLGLQGLLGPTALALGLTDAFSVGVGYLESYSYSAMVGRQRATPNPEKPPRSAGAGVYFPRLSVTLPRPIAELLLSDTGIRDRLACRLDSCATGIDQAAVDPRRHYLHSRTNEIQELLAYPPAWRPNAQKDHLGEALKLRRLINSNHRSEDMQPLKTRTVSVLIKEIASQPAEGWQAS